jgi:hypothetical protein
MASTFIQPHRLLTPEFIARHIYLIRGQKVMLDTDLAELYGVKAIRLREQVKRNRERFPSDFMIQLTEAEVDRMVSQNAIPSRQHLGGYLPYVFTQEGVAMLSSVLRSERAVQVNITIMRAFVRLREMLASNRDLARKLEVLEKKFTKHDKPSRQAKPSQRVSRNTAPFRLPYKKRTTSLPLATP